MSKLIKANFIGSFTNIGQCPQTHYPEFAFIGRSNVGKSSLINTLIGQKNLAKTSSTPGKTQLINYFEVDERFYFVDLPGYGYAKVSRDKRTKWHKNTMKYLRERHTLVNVFVLIDSNLPPQKIDLEFLSELGRLQVPLVLVFTKIDKSPSKVIQYNQKLFREEMLKTWSSLPIQFESSSIKKQVCNDLLQYIYGLVNQVTKVHP